MNKFIKRAIIVILTELIIILAVNILVNRKESEDRPYIVEIKSMNTFSYKKQEHHASGRKQCQLYMYLTGIHKGIVLCDDKNTQEFKVKTYEYNPSEIAKYIRRLERIQEYKDELVLDKKLVKRHKSCTGYNCKKAQECPMRDVCFRKSKERI